MPASGRGYHSAPLCLFVPARPSGGGCCPHRRSGPRSPPCFWWPLLSYWRLTGWLLGRILRRT